MTTKLDPSILTASLPNHNRRETLDALGERIARLAARITAATHQLLEMLRDFDRQEGWGPGFRSTAEWLSWRTGMTAGAAREKVRVARALGELPKISDAMSRGELSYSKVRALTRVATPENEDDLLAAAKDGTVSQVERLVRAWRRVDRSAETELAEIARAARYLRIHTDDDGMVVIRARLEPEVGARVRKAIEAAEAELERRQSQATAEGIETNAQNVSAETRPPRDHRRADALELLAEAALAAGLARPGTGNRFEVVLHADAAALAGGDGGPAVTADGDVLPYHALRRICCDSALVGMTHGENGTALDAGRRTRAIPPALRRALEARDGHRCRFPGCEVRHTDAHHLHHWADGGETNLDNLVLLCRRHHRCVHEEGFTCELRPNGQAVFRTPRGRRLTDAPRPPEIGEDPVAALRHELEEAGVDVDPEAGMPGWWAGRERLRGAQLGRLERHARTPP